VSEETISQMYAGSLLRFIPWDCEGIEMPWGFPRQLSIVDRLLDKERISGSLFRTAVRHNRVSLTPGDTCILLEKMSFAHPSIDSFYVVLHEGQRICVFARFLDVP
jgi:hypothetical protein